MLIQQILSTYGYNLAPLELALWAIPTAIFAFFIHAARLILFDRRLGKSSLHGGVGARIATEGAPSTSSAGPPRPTGEES